MFITVQNHIIQSNAIPHIELESPKILIHLAGRNALEITYSGKADAVSAFKRIAGALEAADTELPGAI